METVVDVVVEMVVEAEEVVTGVVTVTEVREGKVVSVCMEGGKVKLKKEVDSISSSGVVVVAWVEVAFVEVAVECIGAEAEAAYVVTVVVKDEVSAVGLGANVLGLDAVLPGRVCNGAFDSRVDVSIMVAGVFFAVNVASVAAFTEGWNVFSEPLVVSLAVMVVKVPDG